MLPCQKCFVDVFASPAIHDTQCTRAHDVCKINFAFSVNAEESVNVFQWFNVRSNAE